MAKENKLKEYCEMVRIPAFILLAWVLIGAIISIISYELYLSIFGGIASTILIIAVLGFVGYTAVKDNKKTIWEGTKVAIFTGIIVGVFAGVFSLIATIISPTILENTIQQAVAQGASRGQVEGVIKIMTYLSPITAAISYSILGLVTGVIGAVIGKKT